MGKSKEITTKQNASKLKTIYKPTTTSRSKNSASNRNSSKEVVSSSSSMSTPYAEEAMDPDTTNQNNSSRQQQTENKSLDFHNNIISNPLKRRDAVKFRDIYLHANSIDCPAQPWLLADYAMHQLLTKHHDKKGASAAYVVSAKPIFIFKVNEHSIPASVKKTVSIKEMLQNVKLRNVELVSYNGKDGVYYRKRARELRIKGDGVKAIKRHDAFDFYSRLESGNSFGSDHLKTSDQIRIVIEDELANTTVKQNLLVDDLEIDGDFGTLQELNYLHNPVDYFLPGFGGNVPKAAIIGSYLLSPSVMTTGGFLSMHALASESIGSRCWLIYNSVGPRKRPIHVDLNNLLREHGEGSLHSLIGKQFTEQCCKWLESGLVLFHPIKLKELGIAVDVYIQKPGEFAILPPYTCYSTYDTGKGLMFSTLLLPPSEFFDYGVSSYLDYEEKYNYSSGCGQRWKTHRTQREQACKHFMPLTMTLKEYHLRSFYNQNRMRCENSDIKKIIPYKPLQSLTRTNRIRQMCSLGLWVTLPDHGKHKKVSAIIIKPADKDIDFYLAQRSNVKSTSHVVHKNWIVLTQRDKQRKCDSQPQLKQNTQIVVNLNTVGRVYRRWMPLKEEFRVNRIKKRENDENPFEQLHDTWEGEIVELDDENMSAESDDEELDNIKTFKIPTFFYSLNNKARKKNYEWENTNISSAASGEKSVNCSSGNQGSVNSNVSHNSIEILSETSSYQNILTSADSTSEKDSQLINSPIPNNSRRNNNCDAFENNNPEYLQINDVLEYGEKDNERKDEQKKQDLSSTTTMMVTKPTLEDNALPILPELLSTQHQQQSDFQMPLAEINTSFVTSISKVLYCSRELIDRSSGVSDGNLAMTNFIHDIIKSDKSFLNKNNIDLLCTVTDQLIKTSCGFSITLRDAQQYETERVNMLIQTQIEYFLTNHTDRIMLFANFSPLCGHDCIFHMARPHGEIEAIYISNLEFAGEDSIIRGRCGVIVFKTITSAEQCDGTSDQHYNRSVSFFRNKM